MKHYFDEKTFSYSKEIRAYIFTSSDKNLHVFNDAKSAYIAYRQAERAERNPRWQVGFEPKTPFFQGRGHSSLTYRILGNVKEKSWGVREKYLDYCMKRIGTVYKEISGSDDWGNVPKELEKPFLDKVYQLVSGDFGLFE